MRGYIPTSIVYRHGTPRGASLQVYVVEYSGSTLSNNSIELAKSLIRGQSRYNYSQRIESAVFAFQGKHCRRIYGPGRCEKTLLSQLARRHAGGETPLRLALRVTRHWMMQQWKHGAWSRLQMTLITDGRCTQPVADLDMPWPVTVIDTENAPVRLNFCKNIADQLHGWYIHVNDLPKRIQ